MYILINIYTLSILAIHIDTLNIIYHVLEKISILYVNISTLYQFVY